MRKIITIFLLFQFLTNNAFAEEIIKLPKLISHYNHHNKEHKDTNNFMDYLVQHYLTNGHEKDEHKGEDKSCELPFKHCSDCCVNVHVPLVGFISSLISVDFSLANISNTKYFFENERIETISATSIWQPPKIA